MENELWKDLPGWEGYYAVSDQGRVKRLSGSPRCKVDRILKPMPTERGYLVASPVRTGHKQVPQMVHRLVLVTFVGPAPTPAHEPNHLNGLKTDNRLANLEWSTRAENIAHAYREGLHGHYVGSAASAAKLTEDQVADILALVAQRAYRKDIAARFSISTKMIAEIVAGDHWKHVPRPANLNQRRLGRQVLTADQVREIRGHLANGKLKHGQIGKLYGVSAGSIWHIAAGRTWQDVA